jgi:hypothetical protein
MENHKAGYRVRAANRLNVTDVLNTSGERWNRASFHETPPLAAGGLDETWKLTNWFAEGSRAQCPV